MHIESLKIRGIGCHDDLTVPIADLGDAQLVAVCGDNGAGKTTALECVPGVVYRSMPSRGPLSLLANARDSFVEAGFSMGGEGFVARVKIDGVSKTKKAEAYLFNEEMEPLSNGKVRDYIAGVARYFPDQQTYLASAFAAQTGAGQFLSLPPAARKALFVSMLGLDRFEVWAKAAGESRLAATRTARTDLLLIACLQNISHGRPGAMLSGQPDYAAAAPQIQPSSLGYASLGGNDTGCSPDLA